jgi:hypothetical protein
MKATLPAINRHISSRFPELDIELVKGNGYFYFSGDDGMGIESIYVCHLNQCDMDWWISTVDASIEAAQ